MPPETRAKPQMMCLPPSLGRPRRRTGHPLGHDGLNMPVIRPAGVGRTQRWLETLRAGLGLRRGSGAV